MPCGGIYPLVKGHPYEKLHGHSLNDNCFFCGEKIEKEDLVFCEEWDSYLHRACVPAFLKTPEGQVVLTHGHEVILYYEQG